MFGSGTEALGDAQITIEGDQGTVEHVMHLLTGPIGFEVSFMDVLKFDEAGGKMTVAISLLNRFSKACRDCDFFDHRGFDPSSRCALGIDCLAIGDSCSRRRTEIADEIYGPVLDETAEPAGACFDDIDLSPIPPVPFEKAAKDLTESSARVQACLDSPEGRSPEDMRAVARDAERAGKAAMDAVHRGLAALPPDERERAIAFLAEHGPKPEEWWRRFASHWEE
jgi:hypothetical protein